MKQGTLHTLNRKIHIHFGLALLLLIWLFSLSGLILNHNNWKFTSFWEQRQESNTDFTVPPSSLQNSHPETGVMEFLKISGEVQNMKVTAGLLEFRVQAPGIVRDIRVDLSTGAGTEKKLKYNVWGKLRTLHTFNGMNRENPSQPPNWLITNLWRYTMDGIAIGLIIICISSWIMWYKIRKEYKWGYLVLVCSFVIAGYFLWWT